MRLDRLPSVNYKKLLASLASSRFASDFPAALGDRVRTSASGARSLLFNRLLPGLQALTLQERILAALVITGAVLRLFMLAHKSIWLDEAFSITISQRPWIEVLRMAVRTDTHPPLYYLLLKAWLALGDGEAWVRFLSVIFSLASIPMAYKVTSALYEDDQAGLIAAAILAFSPFQVWYAQEVRMYAMLTFFVLASGYFFIRALRDDERRDWIGFVLTTALALYTDNGAIWFVATIGLFYLAYRKHFPGRFKHWLLGHAAIGLLYLPWLPFFWKQTQQVTEDFWLTPPTFQTVLGTILDFHSYNFPLSAISLIYMAMIFIWAFIVPRRAWQLHLATLWLFVPLIVSLLLSLRQPIFLSRNLIAASLGYYLLIAGTIWQFKSRKVTLALVVPLVVMNLVSIGYNDWKVEKENWRAAATEVAQQVQNKPGGLLVFMPRYAELPFQYYFKRSGSSIQTQGYPGDELLLHPRPRQVTDVSALIEGHPYVWLVVRNVESEDLDWGVKEWLDQNGYVRQLDFVAKDVDVLTYYRWDKAPKSSPPASTAANTKTFLPLIQRGIVYQTYVVRPGETLLEIALRYETTVQVLMDINALQNPHDVSEGQELFIPQQVAGDSNTGNERP
ncbi:MAG TPA: glycosyltransferase family 39 protein [Anaerolineales bacterium]|nr:glycosyltransferase family 39 protein [Anaerolineales bacterium]